MPRETGEKRPEVDPPQENDFSLSADTPRGELRAIMRVPAVHGYAIAKSVPWLYLGIDKSSIPLWRLQIASSRDFR
jgi:hypothetical protein